MKRLIFSCLPVFILLNSCFSQNLVRNGYFESDSCRIWSGISNIEGWFQLNTADYYHLSCQFVANTTYIQPYEGRGCAGLYNGGFNTLPSGDTFPTHEYIVGMLTEPLVAGEKYDISFWVKPSSFFDKPSENMTTDNISLAFIGDTSELRLNRLPPFNIIINLEADIVNTTGIITDIDSYTPVKGCYTADGTERFVVIGNFSPFGETTLIPLSPNTLYHYSYFLVDNVEVKKVISLPVPTDTTLCRVEEYILDVSDSGNETVWLNGVEVRDTLRIKEEGSHIITSKFGSCFTDYNLRFETEECVDCNFYIPNAFSPDFNGINDRTSIDSNCQFEVVESRIFDRWGNMVYQSNGDFSWNGSLNGRRMNTGVFLYLIKVKISNPLNQSTRLLSGDLTLLR